MARYTLPPLRPSVPQPAPRRSGHLERRVHTRRSCSPDAHRFRTQEAQGNQPRIFRATVVIFAQAGQPDMAEGVAHAAGVHDTSTVTHRCSTRHTDAIFATIQAIVWSARASSVEDATGHHACRGMPQRTRTDGSPLCQLGAVLSVSCRGLVWTLDPIHSGRRRARATAVYLR